MNKVFEIFELPPADPINLPLTYSPVPVICILTAYLLFVFKVGKLFMKNRQPYNIKKLMLIYNATQMIYNGIIVYYAIRFMFFGKVYKYRCMESLPLDHPYKNIERYICYMYFLNKILDLTDTVFFVLRKSYKQISVLHVYHHVMMVLVGYLMLRFYGYGGHICIMGFLNTFVHVVMYGYYFLTALNPAMKQQIWWKKYITVLQMLQFTIVVLHSSYVILFSRACAYPKLMLLAQLSQSATMFLMFANFYVHAYVKTGRKLQKID